VERRSGKSESLFSSAESAEVFGSLGAVEMAKQQTKTEGQGTAAFESRLARLDEARTSTLELLDRRIAA
jgi:hypothetical protein